MAARLDHITLENFKSFKGKTIVGPFRNFSAVVGPNGSGKSNFMDAVSFAMGEKTSCLRVKRLSELIHGAATGRSASKSASVTAGFVLGNGIKKQFTRIVHRTSCEYKIDDKVVSSGDYMAALDQLGIKVKIHNFVAYQGEVESLVLQTPKERTRTFEILSGSAAFQDDYDRYEDERKKIQILVQSILKKKKGHLTLKKLSLKQMEEANKYKALQEDMGKLQATYQLFQLYHIEKDIEDIKKEIKSKKVSLRDMNRKKEEKEGGLERMKEELASLMTQLAREEEVEHEKENNVREKELAKVKAQDAVGHLEKKFHSAEKSLAHTSAECRKKENNILDLEKELEALTKEKQEFEQSVSVEMASQGRDIALERHMETEYHRLKALVVKETLQISQQLDSLSMMHKSDILENELRKKNEYSEQLKQMKLKLDDHWRRLENVREKQTATNEALIECQSRYEEIATETNKAKARLPEVQKELELVLQNMGDVKCQKHEHEFDRNKREAVEILQRSFVGVKDRLVNLCQVIDPRYNIAVTKVLSHKMDAIVVDSERTAYQCIEYLRKFCLGRETFYPLDSLRVNPTKEQFRNITDPKGVCLVKSCISYPEEIEPAILFATNNALVCETAGDASRLFDSIEGKKYNVVSLDGTMYHDSGLISGGKADLARKAQRWSIKEINKLKATKERLTTEMRGLTHVLRNESELQQLIVKMKSLEKRQKILSDCEAELVTAHENLQAEEKKLTDNFKEKIEPALDKAQKEMEQCRREMEGLQNQINSIEDRVFADFCAEIGVKNIRQYEKTGLRRQREIKEKLVEFDKRRDVLINQLTYEKSDDISVYVHRWRRVVQELAADLELAKNEQKEATANYKNAVKELDNFKKQLEKMKTQVNRLRSQVAQEQVELKKLNADIKRLKASASSLEGNIEQKQSKFDNILKCCAMESIEIPLLEGTLKNVVRQVPMADLSQESDQNTTANESTASSQDSNSRIVVDYEQLPVEHKSRNSKIRGEQEKILTGELGKLKAALRSIPLPNFKAEEKLAEIKEQLKALHAEQLEAQKRYQEIDRAFNLVKHRRRDLFVNCIGRVADALNTIYKQLTQNQIVEVSMMPTDSEEEYNGGLTLSAIPPGKRYHPMNNLSGGEKTQVALSLLFAMHRYRTAPFFILDEVDAALDNSNINQLASYLKHVGPEQQTIVVSHNSRLLSHADVLFGLCRNPESQDVLATDIFSLDLETYQQ